MVKTNQNGIERWTDIQKKYDETQGFLQKQIIMNEELTGKLQEYKELNNQLEYSWAMKYEGMVRDKDAVLSAVRDASERALALARNETEKQLREIKTQVKQDIMIMD